MVGTYIHRHDEAIKYVYNVYQDEDIDPRQALDSVSNVDTTRTNSPGTDETDTYLDVSLPINTQFDLKR